MSPSRLAVADVAIDRLLAEQGFRSPAATTRAREVLEADGLTRPGKSRISIEKTARVQALLRATLIPVCADGVCSGIASERPQERVEVEPADCAICHGSNNQRAVALLARAALNSAVNRVVIIGGTPTGHRELTRLLEGSRLEVRFVDGSAGRHDAKSARANCAWADLLVIWASTPLPHKVSNLYKPDACPKKRLTVDQRGLEGVAWTLIEHLDRLALSTP